MKTMVSILLGTLVFLTSCDKEIKCAPYAPFGEVMLDLLFVDEDGSYLVKNLPLHNRPSPNYPDPYYSYVESTGYHLSVSVNGQLFEDDEKYPCQASLVNGRFLLVTGANLAGLFDKGADGQDPIYVYEVTLSCSGIYGDDRGHTFRLERKRSNAGLTNNCERLFYDGKLIAEGEEGARPPGPETPFVIVVPQK